MKRRLVAYASDAGEDLDWIYDAIAGAGSPVTASRYEQAIRAFLRRSRPCVRTRRRDDIRRGLRVIGFGRRVTVAFAVEEGRVVILRISYGERDWEVDWR